MSDNKKKNSFADSFLDGTYNSYFKDNSNNKKNSFADSFLDGTYNDYKFKSSNKKEEEEEKKKISEKKNGKSDSWFQGGAFSDGYQIGDITKSLGSTVADIGKGVAKGVANIGEGIGDLAQYGVAGASDMLGNEEYADKLRKKAQVNSVDNLFEKDNILNRSINSNSILGEKSDNITQGLGYVASILATGGAAGALGASTLGATAATGGLTFSTSMGSGMSQAYQGGATDDEATKYGFINGIAEAGTELIFGGLGKTVKAVGLNTGLSSADDMLAKKISGIFESQLAKNMSSVAVKSGAEGLEEVASGVIQAVGQKLTYMKEEDISKLIEDQDLLEQFISGAVVSGIVQTPSARKYSKEGRDILTGYTQNEQSVIDNEINTRTAELQKQQSLDSKVNDIINKAQNTFGEVSEKRKETIKNMVKNKIDNGEIEYTKLDNKTINNIRKEVEQDLEKGYIGIDTIESTLSKDRTEKINELQTKLDKAKGEKLKTKLQNQIKELKTERSAELNELLKKDNYLQESYRQENLKKVTFEHKAQDTDTEITKELAESAKNAGMNNTRKMQDLFEWVNKVANEKGTSYGFVNDTQLQETGYYDNLGTDREQNKGKIGGLVSVTKDGKTKVLINVDSDKAINTIIGHETTHLLEGTNEYNLLQDVVKEYATTKGEYDTKYKDIESLYDGTSANIDNEVTSELVGKYLFTDEQFIKNLSVKQPNVFTKVYDYIKHAYKMVTAGSKEARQLEQVKYRFDQAYKANVKNVESDTKYSLSNNKYNYQSTRTKPNGGWTIDKIQNQLENESSSVATAEEISKYTDIKDLMDNIYYHGSISAHDNLKAGSTLPESARTGGYGQEYNSISLSKSKNIASNFASIGKEGTVTPVLLKKDANVIEMPEIEDSIELEDYLPELWDKGVDAVKIGDWDIETVGYGEQEIVILNPNAIATMGEGTEHFKNFKKPKFNNMNEEEVKNLYDKYKSKQENPDIRYSQSEQNKNIAPIGKYNVYGKDIKIQKDEQNLNENEKISKNTTKKVKKAAPIKKSIAPVDTKKEYKTFLDNLNTAKEKYHIRHDHDTKRVLEAYYKIKYIYDKADKTKIVEELKKSYDDNEKLEQMVLHDKTGKYMKNGQYTNRGETVLSQYSTLESELQSLISKNGKYEGTILQLVFEGSEPKAPDYRIKGVDELTKKERIENYNKFLKELLDLENKYGNSTLLTEDMMNQIKIDIDNNNSILNGEKAQDIAPVSQDVVEQHREEGFTALNDNDIYPIAENTTPEVETNTNVESPLDSRDIDEVGNRKVKAYQYENPEVRPYFQAEAQNMIHDIDNTIKGEKGIIQDELGNTEYYGTTRQTTEAIAYLKDNYGYSYDQIRNGLNAIIEDNGLENNAVSKRIEFMLDERLRKGYTTSDGYQIPSNQEYINFLRDKQVTQYNQEAFNSLTDDDVPFEVGTMPQNDTVQPQKIETEQVAPITEKVAQNVNNEQIETKQRSWAKTSTESESIKDQISIEDLDKNKINYEVKSNKKSLAKANEILGSYGYDKSIQYVNSKMMDKKVTTEDVVLGERLIQEALNRGDNKTAAELIENVSILGTELGQTIQALSIIQRLTPEGQLKLLQKTVSRGKLKEDKAFNNVEVTQKMADKILNTRKPDGSFDQKELNKAVEEVKQDIANTMETTLGDKANAWRYLAMLGNPKTHIRNIVSNVANKGTTAVKNTLARTMEDLIAPTNGRTRTWKKASDTVTKYSDTVTLEMKDMIMGENKYSEETGLKSKRKVFQNNILNKIYKFNNDLMQKEDWWFSKGAFKNSFKEYLTANNIRTEKDIRTNPKIIEKAKAYAVEQAEIATFRQYSYLANKISELENRNIAGKVMIGSVIPFKRTPINIAKAGLSYSPLGFAKTLTTDMAAVKNGTMEASQLIDNLAKNTTGSALVLIGYMLASSGFLNGGGEDDKEGKYDSQLGESAYSLKIGDKSYSLSWLSPLAIPMFVGANAYEKLTEDTEWNADVVVQTLAQTLDPLSEMSFLSGLTQVLSSYETGVEKFAGMGKSMIQNYATQFIPTVSSQLAATTDDIKRTTTATKEGGNQFIDATINKLKYKIPGLRQTLEPSLDIWGNEVKQAEDIGQRAIDNFIAPYATKKDTTTPIDTELKSVYRETGENSVIPSNPYSYLNYDDKRYDMTSKEYTEFKKKYGQTSYEMLEELFNTSTYATSDTNEKAKLIKNVYDYAKDESKKEYFGSKEVEYTNTTKDNIPVYKENSIKGAIENDMTVDEYNYYTENPSKYSTIKAVTDYETYKTYAKDISNIEANKNANGDSVSGSKKQKVFDYINGLDMGYEQKVLLAKMYYPAEDRYNYDIIDYLNNNNDIDYNTMSEILIELGFKVDDNGSIKW